MNKGGCMPYILHCTTDQAAVRLQSQSAIGCRSRRKTLAELHSDHRGLKVKEVIPETPGPPCALWRCPGPIHITAMKSVAHLKNPTEAIPPPPLVTRCWCKGLYHRVLQTRMACTKVLLWSTDHLKGHHTRDHIYPICTPHLHWCYNISVWMGCRKLPHSYTRWRTVMRTNRG